MNAELIAVGTELLLGEISNTDGQYISQKLAGLGINVFYHTVVGDNPARLEKVLRDASQRSDLIITTGGLGPTYDDLTKELICSVFGRELELHPESLARIEAFFTDRGRPMTENNVKQAYLPKDCTVFANDWGTAPGCAFEADGCIVAMLPGPPRECRPMTDLRLVPYLAAKGDGVIYSDSVRICGMGESAVEDKLRPMMENALNPTVAPYCKLGEVELRVTAKAQTEELARELTAPVVEEIKRQLGSVVYGVNVDSLEQALVQALNEKKLTLATAESCTGGLVSKRITDISGSSAVFLGGVVSYANSVKSGVLGVKEETLAAHGAVSPETAREMALGVCRLTGADIGVSLTGIAGPGGGTEEKPVGLVYMGLCRDGNVEVTELRIGSRGRTRDDIRSQAATTALKAVLDEIRK
ncbi:MAG: competence/damage-inducible protein A [Clostridia bacterium]|nr:competence/damage-inducible protein A [Clostridia bacterium]